MPVICKQIEWSIMPRVAHGEIGVMQGRYGLRKVAGLINEEANPRRPRSSPPLSKPFTLELYVPVIMGKDRVLKFQTEAAAKAEASRAVLRFVADCTEEVS